MMFCMTNALTSVVTTTATTDVAKTDEVIRMMIEQNFNFLHVIAETTMTWWVASIVFCAAIVGAFLSEPERFKKLPQDFRRFAKWTVHCFFLFFPIYGSCMIYNVTQLKYETVDFIKRFGLDSLEKIVQFDIVRGAVIIGVFAFFPAIFLWEKLSPTLIGQESDRTLSSRKEEQTE